MLRNTIYFFVEPCEITSKILVWMLAPQEVQNSSYHHATNYSDKTFVGVAISCGLVKYATTNSVHIFSRTICDSVLRNIPKSERVVKWNKCTKKLRWSLEEKKKRIYTGSTYLRFLAICSFHQINVLLIWKPLNWMLFRCGKTDKMTNEGINQDTESPVGYPGKMSQNASQTHFLWSKPIFDAFSTAEVTHHRISTIWIRSRFVTWRRTRDRLWKVAGVGYFLGETENVHEKPQSEFPTSGRGSNQGPSEIQSTDTVVDYIS
jgi:hypothetical protein